MIRWIDKAPVLRGRWAKRFEPLATSRGRWTGKRRHVALRPRRRRRLETWQPSPAAHFRHVSWVLGYSVSYEALEAALGRKS